MRYSTNNNFIVLDLLRFALNWFNRVIQLTITEVDSNGLEGEGRLAALLP